MEHANLKLAFLRAVQKSDLGKCFQRGGEQPGPNVDDGDLSLFQRIEYAHPAVRLRKVDDFGVVRKEPLQHASRRLSIECAKRDALRLVVVHQRARDRRLTDATRDGNAILA
jgi:hypothetical protein